MSGCPQCVWLSTACLDVHTPQHVWMSTMCLVVHSVSGCPDSTACLDVQHGSDCPQPVWYSATCTHPLFDRNSRYIGMRDKPAQWGWRSSSVNLEKKAASIFISWQVKSLLPSSSKPIVTLLVTLRAMMPAT